MWFSVIFITFFHSLSLCELREADSPAFLMIQKPTKNGNPFFVGLCYIALLLMLC